MELASIPLLTLITFLPLVGVVAVLISSGGTGNARPIALLTALLNLLFAIVLWLNFDSSTADFQFVEERDWLPALGISWRAGVDGISLFFVVLAAFLTPICLIASWDSINHRVREYMAAFLALESCMIGMFVSLDVITFYIFFEAVLVPMFLIIGIWGGQNRFYAAFKLFLYTLAGSVLMLIGLLVLYRYGGTTDMTELLKTAGLIIPASTQNWLWLAFFAAFAVKVPMVPVHTWLPDAHVQAPTAGSVILAGVLLKMGAYGFLRFSIPMLPLGTETFIPLIFTLSIIAVIYTSLIALVQEDMKKLIAYSSIAHMGFVTAGLFTLTTEGMAGAVFQMISHGIVSGALFLCVGVVYDRLHTREIARYGGVAHIMPKYAVLFLVFTMASIGLPATSGFVGEFLVLQGSFMTNTWLALLIATGMILGAGYMLILYKRVMLGEVVHEDVKTMPVLTVKEKITLIPLAVITLWMGIYPVHFLEPMEASIENLVENYNSMVQRGS